MLRAEFQSLKMSFDQHRQNSSGKRRIVYPAELRKRASALVSQGTRPNRVARELGVSFSAVKTWMKAFPTEPVEAITPDDMVPVNVAKDSKAPAEQTCRMKVTSIELEVPRSKTFDTLKEILAGLGGRA